MAVDVQHPVAIGRRRLTVLVAAAVVAVVLDYLDRKSVV